MKNVFSNYIDLALYQSVVTLFDLDGMYAYDQYTPKLGVTVDGILDDLKHPKRLSIGELRAYALAVAGSELETEALAERAVELVEATGDVFLTVATCRFWGGKNKDLGQRYLAGKVFDNLEEATIAVLAFDDEFVGGNLHLLGQLTMFMTGDVSLSFSNPVAFKYLLDYNKESQDKSELLSLLWTAVKDVPDKQSKTIAVLKDYGLRVLDVYEVVYFLRTRLKCFDRGRKKTERAEEFLKVELAQYFRNWTDLDLWFIEQFHGELDSRIYCRYNYKKYHAEYGFRLPELSLNLMDDVALETLLEDLSDVEKCKVAQYLHLDKKGLRRLGAKFKDWDVSLQEYYDAVGPIRGASDCYKLSEMSIEEVVEKYGEDSRECYAKVMLSGDEQYSVVLLKYSVNDWVQFVRYHRNGVSEELLAVYDELRCINADALITVGNDLERAKELASVGGSLRLLEAVDAGLQFSLDWDNSKAILLLSMESLTTEEYVDLLTNYSEELDSYEYSLSKWDAEGTLYQKVTTKYEIDDKTAFCKWLANGYYGKEFRSWAHLSMCDCLKHWEVASGLLDEYSSTILRVRYDAQYDSIMQDVVHEWVVTGSPFHAMNSKHGLPTLLGETSKYQSAWFSIAEKKIEEVGSLATMDVNYGWVDGVQCWMTPIGLIVDKVNDKLLDCGIPLYGVSDTGKATQFFVGAPLNGQVENTFVQRVFSSDEVVTVRLIKW